MSTHGWTQNVYKLLFHQLWETGCHHWSFQHQEKRALSTLVGRVWEHTGDLGGHLCLQRMRQTHLECLHEGQAVTLTATWEVHFVPENRLMKCHLVPLVRWPYTVRMLNTYIHPDAAGKASWKSSSEKELPLERETRGWEPTGRTSQHFPHSGPHLPMMRHSSRHPNTCPSTMSLPSCWLTGSCASTLPKKVNSPSWGFSSSLCPLTARAPTLWRKLVR